MVHRQKGLACVCVCAHAQGIYHVYVYIHIWYIYVDILIYMYRGSHRVHSQRCSASRGGGGAKGFRAVRNSVQVDKQVVKGACSNDQKGLQLKEKLLPSN